MEMKTIFITSFHPLISRNILMGGILSKLAEAHRIVLLVPAYKASYFKEHFKRSNVAVEGVPTALTVHDIFFRKMMLASTPTRDLFIKKRAEFFKDRKLFSYLATVIPAILFGRSKQYIKLLRAFDSSTADTTRFTALFDRYKPALVCSTDVQNELDIAFLRGARKRGIRTAAMVRSWDNLTSKGILRFIPDRLLVHNEIIKEEAVRLSFVNPTIISVIGIPHYDRYKQAYDALRVETSRAQRMRTAFCAAWKLDPKKKLILFAPFGDRYIRDNQTDILILETLSEFDANILVRLPPTDTVNFNGFKTRKARVQFYESGIGSWEGGKKINEISPADENELVQSLSSVDLVVTGQSTISVDAAAFGKPAVIAAFDHEPRAYYDSVLRYFDYEYYRKLRERSLLCMARNPEELKEAVGRYLVNPAADADVRSRIMKDQLYAFDGKASQRFTELITDTLHGY